MWNRRKEDEYPAKPAQTNPSIPVDSTRESPAPMSQAPSRMEPEPYRSSSTGQASIGKSVVIKGQIMSKEDLYLDGELEGTVEVQDHRLTIGPNGRVQANVKAREIVIIGTIHGNVDASDKIEIRKEARLVGDIRTARIVIEDGAYFKGSIDIAKQQEAKTPAEPNKQPQQPRREQQTMAAGAGTSAAANETKR